MLTPLAQYGCRLARVFAIIVCCLLFASCSSKMAYNFVDWYLMWKVEKYADLNPEQKKQAAAAFDDFHEWHRTTQLPRYAEYMRGLKERLAQPVTAESLHAETDEMQLMIDDSMAYLMPTAVSIISSFSDAQAQQMLEKLEKDREDYHKKYLSGDMQDLAEARINELKDKIGPFFGRFTDQQKEWVDDWARDMEFYEPLMLKQQEDWAHTLEEVLNRRHDKAFLAASLRKLMFYRSDDWHPELERMIDVNQALSLEMGAKFMNHLTPKQREKMNKKLDKYIEVFEEIAADAQ